MKISIITPSYNRADIVGETANSIFRQTHTDWEWIIVDDGSRDNSLSIFSRYCNTDERVRFFKRDRDPKGAATCRNIAVEKSSGDYLIFLDTDDVLASFCLEQRAKAAERFPDVDLLMFPSLLFKKNPEDLRLLWNIDNDEDDINRFLHADPACCGTGTLWKKKSFIKAGGWNEDLVLWQDVDLHLRSLLNGVGYKKFFHLPPDLFVRVSDTSVSRTGYYSAEKLQSRIKVFSENIQRLNKKNLLAKYKDGARYMFLSIFIGAVNASNFRISRSLLRFIKTYRLFASQETGLMKKYLAMRRMKLYKLNFMQQRFDRRLNKLKGNYVFTLGKIPYQQKIII